MGGNCINNTFFKEMDSPIILGKFLMDVQVLNIEIRHVILYLCSLTETGCLVDTRDKCLRNISIGYLIPGSIRWIHSVLRIEEQPRKNSKMQMIVDPSE